MNDNKIATESQVMDQATADRMSATLGIATRLSEGLMPQGEPEQPTEASQTPETAPEQEEQPQPEETPQPQEEAPQEANPEIQQLTKDFDEFKGKIEGVIETKFNDLTKTLENALKED